jgi:hypothetical protein
MIVMHAADLFAVAGVGLPDDEAPRDRRATARIPALISAVISMSMCQRRLLLQQAAEMQATDGVESNWNLKAYELYPQSYGAILVRMLHNRNLDWLGGAKALYLMAVLWNVRRLTASQVDSLIDQEALK